MPKTGKLLGGNVLIKSVGSNDLFIFTHLQFEFFESQIAVSDLTFVESAFVVKFVLEKGKQYA